MFLATTNQTQRLLHLSYIQRVSVKDLQRGYEDVVALLVEFPNGFRMLAALGRLEPMDVPSRDSSAIRL